MSIAYRRVDTLDAADVAALFRAAGLRRPVDDLERIAAMIANANLIVAAFDGDRLVGIARALTDFAYCCYLSDLAVHPDRQRQGIGKQLIARVQDAIGDGCSLLLLTAPEAAGYYPKLGFTQPDTAWLRPRRR